MRCSARVWKSVARCTGEKHFCMEEWNACAFEDSKEFKGEHVVDRTNAFAAVVELCDEHGRVLLTNAPWERVRFVDDVLIIMLPMTLQGACRVDSLATPFTEDAKQTAFRLTIQTASVSCVITLTHREMCRARHLSIN